MAVFQPEGSLIHTPENIRALSGIDALQEAGRAGQILEGRAVVCDSGHNLVVELGFAQGIIPREEGAVGIREGTTRDIAILSRVGKPVCFQLQRIDFREGRPCPILSRRQAQELCWGKLLSHLRPGDLVDCRVTHLEPFGAFVDLGCGIPSLIPIDAISVSRISHPADRFRPGQDIKGVIRWMEKGRITLSHKELLGSWEENAALFQAGETVAGIIRSVEPYGVFVELTPNLAGLAEPCPGVRPGQHASVYIKSLIPEKMKVKLVIVDAFDARYPPSAPRYFLPQGRLERWRYSPQSSPRVVETVFDP